MTQIGVLVVDWPTVYRFGDYTVELVGAVDRDEDLHSLRELFAKARVGTAVHDIPGDRPRGEDMDDDLRNTQYVQFTHGDRPVTAWYLLRGYAFFQDETAVGMDEGAYVFRAGLFFIGTTAFYQAGFAVKDMEDVEDEKDDNSWGI